MIQTFRLKKGQITFAEDRIIISDKAKEQKVMTLLSTGVYSIFGLMNINKFEQTGDEFFYIFWVVITILGLIMFAVNIFSSTKSVIHLTDIKSLKVKHRFSNTFLDIKLSNNQIRRVIQIEDALELKEYVVTNLEDLTRK